MALNNEWRKKQAVALCLAQKAALKRVEKTTADVPPVPLACVRLSGRDEKEE